LAVPDLAITKLLMASRQERDEIYLQLTHVLDELTDISAVHGVVP